MPKNSMKHGSLVYSSDKGRMCPGCSQPVTLCRCREKTPVQDDGIVRVGRQTKGRKGKGVTLISGLPLDHEKMKQLGQQLKRKCGSGGSVKNSIIEIQGDHRDLLVEELTRQGYFVKRTGG